MDNNKQLQKHISEVIKEITKAVKITHKMNMDMLAYQKKNQKLIDDITKKIIKTYEK